MRASGLLAEIPFRFFNDERHLGRRYITRKRHLHARPREQANGSEEAETRSQGQHADLPLTSSSKAPAACQMAENERHNTADASGDENPDVEGNRFPNGFHSGWLGQAERG